MNAILDIAKRYNLRVIEDCAQALGASYYSQLTQATQQTQPTQQAIVAHATSSTNSTNSINSINSTNWRMVGSLGNAGCLSFFPSKSLGAYGDGGMVVTDDPEVAEEVRLLRVHGSQTRYQHVMHGFNSRLDALQAAILRVKLRHLDEWNELRRAKAALYTRLLSELDGIEPPYSQEHCKPSCNYHTLRISGPRLSRDELRKHLESKGIQTMVYYPLSLHLQEVYKPLGYKPGDFPESERAQQQVLTLPMYPELPDEHIEEIVGEIRRFANR